MKLEKNSVSPVTLYNVELWKFKDNSVNQIWQLRGVNIATLTSLTAQNWGILGIFYSFKSAIFSKIKIPYKMTKIATFDFT